MDGIVSEPSSYSVQGFLVPTLGSQIPVETILTMMDLVDSPLAITFSTPTIFKLEASQIHIGNIETLSSIRLALLTLFIDRCADFNAKISGNELPIHELLATTLLQHFNASLLPLGLLFQEQQVITLDRHQQEFLALFEAHMRIFASRH